MPTEIADPTDGRPTRHFEPGEVIVPGFTAGLHLGTGHRFETWLAWSSELCLPVALKVPRPDQLEHPRARRGLVRESQLLSRLRHPGFPRLLLARTTAPEPFLALEYLDGPPLDAVLAEQGPAPSLEVARLGLHLAVGCRYLHRLGMAHVDLKPANVILRDGQPVIVDLGSARRLGTPQPAGKPLGSPGYSSPELEACHPISVGMDVFGVGTILYEALTGVPAFEPPDQDETPTWPTPQRPSRLVRGANRRLVALIDAMIDPDPSRRPSDMDGVLAALTAVSGRARLWPSWAPPIATDAAFTAFTPDPEVALPRPA